MRMFKKVSLGLITFFFVGCSTTSFLPADKCFEKGKEKQKENNISVAYKFFDAASRKQPDNSTYQWAAALTSPNQNAAFFHTQLAWNNGLKRPEVLLAMAKLSFHTEKKSAIEFGLSLIKQLPDTMQLPRLRSDVFFLFNEIDSCLAIMLPIFRSHPNFQDAGYIEELYERKGDHAATRVFLQECRNSKILNEKGYAMLASYAALAYNYKKADSLFDECRDRGLYTINSELEQAGVWIAGERYDDAERSLNKIMADKNILISHRAKIALSYIFSVLNQPQKILGLQNNAVNNRDLQKGESLFLQALANELCDSLNALDAMKKAQTQIPYTPFLSLITAREYAKKGNYKDAIIEYKKCPAIFLMSPRTLVEYAQALNLSGYLDEAMALISTFHASNMATKQSLELFRNMAFKKNLVEQGEAAQKLLEEKFKGDEAILFSGAIIALKTGKSDSALAILTALSQKYPKEEKIEIARISVYLIKNQFSKVLEECKKSKISSAALASIEARAYRGLGNNQSADSVYEKAMTESKTTGVKFEYIGFLIESNKPEKAAAMYDDLVNQKKFDVNENPFHSAMLLNNLAWALLQIPSFPQGKVLSYSKQAFELSNKDPHILDTYAFALIKCTKYKECIGILNENPLCKREPRLLIHLATAYEKSRDINKAVRCYQDVLKSMDNNQSTLDVPIQKDDVKIKIENLIAAN